MTVRCHRCGRELAAERVGVRELCAACGAYLHCCRNCDFFAPGVANDCREPQAERVADKDQGNFCDYFRPALRPGGAAEGGTGRARKELDRLFGRKPVAK